MNISLPSKVNYIIQELLQNGHDAYAVGGCVRDSIMGRIPEDWDITTSASPYQVKEIFHRTIDTGIQHGTVTVMLGTEGFEVTTYRIDGEYEDNRHPKQVEFTEDLAEDLKRRDFTINAMAFNENVGLVDLFGGLEDLKKKVIRCVGSSKDRFDEDALRILRAVRFSAQLNFEIAEDTLTAVKEKALNLNNISAERIREELNKLLLSEHPEKLLIAYETGITKVVLPEFDIMMDTDQENKHHIYSVGIHSLEVLKNIKPLVREFDKKVQLMLTWASLLHDVAKPETKFIGKDNQGHFYGHAEKGADQAKHILKRLKFDNETIDMVSSLIKHHDYRYGLAKAGIRRAVNRIGDNVIELLFLLQEADIRAQNPEFMTEKRHQLEEAKAIYAEVKDHNECTSLKMLSINGKDLIDAGYPPGKELGELLTRLLEAVLEEPEKNTKEELLKYAKQIKPMEL